MMSLGRGGDKAAANMTRKRYQLSCIHIFSLNFISYERCPFVLSDTAMFFWTLAACPRNPIPLFPDRIRLGLLIWPRKEKGPGSVFVLKICWHFNFIIAFWNLISEIVPPWHSMQDGGLVFMFYSSSQIIVFQFSSVKLICPNSLAKPYQSPDLTHVRKSMLSPSYVRYIFLS